MLETDATAGLRDDLLLALAHDLRAPVSAISGIATLVRDDPNLDRAAVRQAAEVMLANAGALASLTEQLGALRWTAPGRFAVERVDLAKVVLTSLESLWVDRVVPALETATAWVAPPLVGRIVENLVRNALLHGGDDVIDVRVRPDGDGALLAVEDRGPGIPPGERELVFEPFARAARTSDGWGVGLYLVRRLAVAMGGEAWVDEREGGGASVRVRLPGEPCR
jgi:two-component system sensor histidine kinase KdpD